MDEFQKRLEERENSRRNELDRETERFEKYRIEPPEVSPRNRDDFVEKRQTPDGTHQVTQDRFYRHLNHEG